MDAIIRHKQLPAAFVAGSLMPFSFSPYDHAWLVIPALACLFWLIQRSHASQAHPLWIGFFFGLGWFGVGAWWLAPTLHTYGHLPWVVAGFCVLLVGSVMALLPALWAWLSVRIAGSTVWLMPAFAIAAVFEEWLRGHLFTGLPWTALGNVLLGTPAIGWGAYFGVYGLALLPALMAAAIVQLCQRDTRRWGSAGLTLCAALIFFAPGLTPEPNSRQAVKTAALIQGNIPQDVKWNADFLNETMHRYARLSAHAKADIIIWPEAAVPFFLSRSPAWSHWLAQRIDSWHTPLLFGGLKEYADGTAQNGMFAIEPTGDTWDFAGKQHLVPFGEYVPTWIPFLHTLVPEIAQFRPSSDTAVLQVGDTRYGSLICYESLFPELSRARVLAGAQVLVNITNDAWYGRSPAAWQHMQAARMRAVETGRYVLRAANTGVTAIIAPDGSIEASVPWWTTTLLQGTFKTSSQITTYVRWGDWPLLVGLLIFLVPLFNLNNVSESIMGR